MLSRKHYCAVAARIKELDLGVCQSPTGEFTDKAYQLALAHVAGSLASYFASDNPNFDRSRFLAACKVTA